MKKKPKRKSKPREPRSWIVWVGFVENWPDNIYGEKDDAVSVYGPAYVRRCRLTEEPKP
jgi:hypothetical protein